ncbi:MAG: fused response regulator/phosphatase [Rhodospirillaceae bacterium]
MSAARDPAGDAETSAGNGRLPVAESPILVVDDIEWNRALIGTLLEEAGYTNIRYAVDGLDALGRIAEELPDLVILDIMMPGIDGFEVLRRLRADPAYAGLPVLVQTALSGVEDRNRAFDAGTTDLVTKPLDRAELLARVTIHLENRALIRSLQQYRHRLEGELDMARGIFEHLLPAAGALATLETASGLTIRSHMLRSSELGGDIWGTVRTEDGRVGVYLLDLAGQGVSAALNVCRLHTLVQELSGLAGEPARFLAELNRQARGLMILGEHAKMIFGVVSPAADCFTYASAAASHPVLLLPGSPAPLFGEATGLPLGVMTDSVYQQQDLPFPPGAALLLHSNAILDAIDETRPGGCRQRLADLITAARSGASGDGPFPAIAAKLDGVVGNPPIDDHTLVWLSR